MNLDEVFQIDDFIIEKEPPAFYYDSGLDDVYQNVKIKLENDTFISVFNCKYEGDVFLRGDSLEKYNCYSFIEIKEHNLRYDFNFCIMKNMVNNTYFVETSEEHTFLQFPMDNEGVLDYYFINDILKILFFNVPSYEDLYY